jgi:hypothetical protein
MTPSYDPARPVAEESVGHCTHRYFLIQAKAPSFFASSRSLASSAGRRARIAAGLRRPPQADDFDGGRAKKRAIKRGHSAFFVKLVKPGTANRFGDDRHCRVIVLMTDPAAAPEV